MKYHSLLGYPVCELFPQVSLNSVRSLGPHSCHQSRADLLIRMQWLSRSLLSPLFHAHVFGHRIALVEEENDKAAGQAVQSQPPRFDLGWNCQ